MKKTVHIWNGNNRPLQGKVYKRGEEIPEKVVSAIPRLNALTGYGLILQKTIEVEEVKPSVKKPSAKTRKTSSTKSSTTTRKRTSSTKKTTKKDE